MKYSHQVKAIFAGLVLSTSVVPVATADDIEIYTSSSVVSSGSNPNIMFIVDTSGSMGTGRSWVKPSYDPTVNYATTYGLSDSCVATGVYFVEDGKMPNCAVALTNYFNLSALECDHALVGYAADGDKLSPGQVGSLLMVGTYSDQLAHYDTDASPSRWRALSIGTSSDRDFTVECFSDNGNQTANGNGSEYIIDSTEYTGTAPADIDNPHPLWAGGANNVQLYAGNYVNYVNWEPSDNTDPLAGPVELVEKTYLEQVKGAVELMVRGNTRVDIGLMRFDDDSDSDGGAVMYPILDVGEDREDFFNRLDGLNAESWTPLSEVYYEALLYFGGKAMDFSLLAHPSNQVTSSTQMPGNVLFRSPITGTCDKNYIVLLSDGQPKKDDVSTTRQGVLPGFSSGSCSTNITDDTDDDNRDVFTAPGTASTVDNCLDELSLWAATNDVASVSGYAPHEGDQFITTHTIGMKLDPVDDKDAIELMRSAAESSGGTPYLAESEAELIAIFNDIIASALDVNTTFSSPAVSVNAFNRSTHLDDLYFTLFRPEFTKHWPGNLKKYKLTFFTDTADVDGDGDITERLPFIADKNGADAVDANTGFFSATGQSFWSPSADGDEVREGGVVSALTTSRNVYTYTGSYRDPGDTGVKTPQNTSVGVLTASTNVVQTSNSDLDDALLGTAGLSDIVAGTPYRETLINWARGIDVLSNFGVVDSDTDVRPEMGDPLHSEPALIQYGNTTVAGETVPDLVIYTATNDGYLHGFSSVTGAENFAFIPQELLTNLSTLMENPDGTKIYGLDGSVTAWIHDDDGDNAITAGGNDHAYIYFSMRRGGKNIYALDVTDRAAPELMWVIKGGIGDYAELGDTWSTVNVRKIKDGNTEKTVLIFGGGYDESQDSAIVRTTDSKGRAVFIADALSGARLWSGGQGGDLTVADMDYSIPARVQPLDVSGDGLIDRLYAADMGGQIFRFDINNTNGAALSSSITGARIADLAGAAAADARRFYYPPDVALVSDDSGKYNALVISSGYRAHPLNTTIHDRIYMIKDKQTGPATTYPTSITEADLKDVTLNLAGGDGANDAARVTELGLIQGKDGWFINLDDESNPGTWIGEKGLAEALLIEGVAIVTTYTPNVAPAENTCGPALGLGKVFFLDILDGTPAFPSNVDVRSERHVELKHSGIPPTPHLIIPDGEPPCLAIGAQCNPVDLGLGIRKTYWFEEEK